MAILTASGGKVMPGPRRTFTDFFGPAVTAKRAGGAATGATGDTDLLMIAGYGYVPSAAFEYHIKGTQTILAPVKTDTGLDVGMDQTDNDGVELTNGILYRANSPNAFKVGTDGPFYFKCTLKVEDVSGTDDCAVGFRKAEAYQANIDDYDEAAFLNVISGDIKIETILNNAATVTTDTTQDLADNGTVKLAVYVSGSGVVTFQVNDAAPTVTAAYTFDNGEMVIPFFFMLNATDLVGKVELMEWDCGLQ